MEWDRIKSSFLGHRCLLYPNLIVGTIHERSICSLVNKDTWAGSRSLKTDWTLSVIAVVGNWMIGHWNITRGSIQCMINFGKVIWKYKKNRIDHVIILLWVHFYIW